MGILTYQELDEALKSYKDYFTKQMTIIAAASEKLTEDLRKLERPRTPSLYDVLVLFFTVPIPPTATTPPPAQTYSDLVKDWMGKNRYALIVAGVVGLALAVGRSAYIWAKRMTDVVQAKQHVRDKEVVVILGADSPLGPLIASDLRSKGYIVMASVSSEEAVADIEMIDQGFINALVLNPCDPSSIAPFFRSLQSALSLPFSLAQGGPHRAPLPSELPVLVSLISLLSLTRPNPAVASTPHSLSTLSISNDYLPHLITTHLTPLTIIQSIIPLFRAAGKKALDNNSRASVIITLPGGPNSVGIVGQDPSHAMASAAMAKASEILRRELSVPPGLAGMRVVVIDVLCANLRTQESSVTPLLASLAAI
ncbi:hypothetical protein FRB97_006978 [Tulasnella sp. 331]|nr:hypothetical protein FRB97_006978 [Tulasnella sp. 331]